MHHKNNISMRCIYLYLFDQYNPIYWICTKKGKPTNPQRFHSPKTSSYKHIYLFILLFFPYTNFGLYSGSNNLGGSTIEEARFNAALTLFSVKCWAERRRRFRGFKSDVIRVSWFVFQSIRSINRLNRIVGRNKCY
jgi:hypothetical protein